MVSGAALLASIIVGVGVWEASGRLWLGEVVAVLLTLVLYRPSRRRDQARSQRRAVLEAGKDRRLFDR
ncbi:hypothetical protein SAMN04489867_1101 [Pedococcus dokdonensis]|uniref:Uncharacterized protein n=1 Tax=Pedococcus dokdonensis TaxID=443156 RepID=A0A1H0P196_9MICO|nr:hypothetical protein SAMN04489867_1101 [Pedococcus dokdonensis]